MRVDETLKLWTDRFSQKGIETARLDARLLVSHVTGLTYEEMILVPESEVEEAQARALDAFGRRREEREPIAYILQLKEFWGLTFEVTSDTLIPRPDTEVLMERMLGFADGNGLRHEELCCLDFGTGTGCLLLSLLHELQMARGAGVDISIEALNVARRNALNLGIDQRATFLEGNWGDGLEGQFDIIVSNPPYIDTAVVKTLQPDVSWFEPHLALDGGADGLDPLRAIVKDLRRLLAPNGVFGVELGIGQATKAVQICEENGLEVLEIAKDLGNVERCLLAQVKK